MHVSRIFSKHSDRVSFTVEQHQRQGHVVAQRHLAVACGTLFIGSLSLSLSLAENKRITVAEVRTLTWQILSPFVKEDKSHGTATVFLAIY